MRPHLILPILVLLSLSTIKAQKLPFDVRKLPIIPIQVYDTLGFGAYQTAIRFAFGEADILNVADYEAIRPHGKVRVEYVYTKFTKSQPSQAALDEARFKALYRLDPRIFESASVEWVVIVQTYGESREETQGLFHGFVITYQPPVSEARKKEATELLHHIVDCAKKIPPPDSPTFPGGEDSLRNWLTQHLPIPTPAETNDDAGKAQFFLKFSIDTTTGKVTKVSVPKATGKRFAKRIAVMLDSMPAWSKGNPDVVFLVMLSYEPQAGGGPRKLQIGKLRGVDKKYCSHDTNGQEELVSSILKRNKDWKNLLVVEDVTGSMMPYVADLLIWNATTNNVKNVNHFVFFNDGDEKADFDKEIGKAGGLYHTKSRKLEEIEETMINAITRGNGGDVEENDIEAILAGIAACPTCQEIVYIADNNATPRDLALLEKITKPVRVVLCGVKYGINPAHLYIAWKTKGSLHTIKEDITSLAELNEGQTIEIMGQKYGIYKGKFKRYYSE